MRCNVGRVECGGGDQHDRHGLVRQVIFEPSRLVGTLSRGCAGFDMHRADEGHPAVSA
jgi:hypothetical protein